MTASNSRTDGRTQRVRQRSRRMMYMAKRTEMRTTRNLIQASSAVSPLTAARWQLPLQSFDIPKDKTHENIAKRNEHSKSREK